MAQMLLARRFAAAMALLPIAGAFFIFLFSAVDSRAEGASGICEDGAGLAVLAGAVTIAIARLSLRKPKPQDESAAKHPPPE